MSKVCAVCGVSFSDALMFCPADGTSLRSAEQSEDLVGSVIAERYLVTEVLGEGGMGKVYLARHVRLPQQAAIKVLRREMLQDPTAVARFNREAANASKIDHDRVARVYDYGEMPDGTVYLAMEFVPGRTLKALLAESGPLEPSRTVELVRQIGEGLDAAHRIAIVHRDLKPENIMVIRDGDREGDERVKVVDFGIAKAFGDSAESAGTVLTRTGFVVGTPEFMSPEQLLGGSLDARSDIYALAIVAYQCLTSELPFSTNSPDFGMAARLVTPPRPLTAVRPSVSWPKHVQAVFDQALARDPADRHPSAGAFARALGDAIEAWTGSRSSAGAGGRSPHVSVGAATAVGAPPTFGAYAPPAPHATAATPTVALSPTVTGSPARSSRMGIMAAVAVLVVAAGGIGAYVMRTPKSAAPTEAASPNGAPNGAPNGSPNATTRAPGATPVNAPVSGGAQSRAAGTRTTPQQAGMALPNATAARNPAGAAAPSKTAASDDAGVLAGIAVRGMREALLSAEKPEAQRMLGQLQEYLPKLTNDADRFEAQVALFEAYGLLEQKPQACAAFGRARALAKTDSQVQQLDQFSNFGC